MSKNLISLLLAICILFCLSACGTTEISSKPTETTSKSDNLENDQMSSNVVSSQQTERNEHVKDEASSNVEDIKDDDTNQMQSSTNQSKPTSSTNHPTHTHSYSNATCTSPQKCSCGETRGSMLGHNYSDATCISPKKCTRCGKTEGTALGHKYEKGVCTTCKVMDEGKYVEEQIKAADKAFTDYTKYNDALKIIKAALQKFPNNAVLKTKRDYYQSFEPKKLTSFNVFDQYNVRVNDGQKDSLGKIHNGVIETGLIEEKGYICYVLDGTYNKLTFNCYGISPSYNSMESISIRDISSGDYDTSTTLYLNESVKSSALPFEVEVDISGVKIVRVWCSSRVAIADAQVQRTVK